MSFCRFAWDGSDVYVIETDSGYECYCKEHPVTETPEAMIVHLASHRRAGLFVPEYAITGLWADIEGAAEPVRPMPESMTEARQIMQEVMNAKNRQTEA